MSAFLEACINCDQGKIRRDFISKCSKKDKDLLNARDKTGKTGLSHLCCNGLSGLVVALSSCPVVDVNLADNEGNTPIIFAAQAVRVLLHRFDGLKVDQPNKQGFTALMKAAIQGRDHCAKILLCAGANPFHRDLGRGLNAVEWADYCSHSICAKIMIQFMTKGRFTIDDYFKKQRTCSDTGYLSNLHCRSLLALRRIRQSLPSVTHSHSSTPASRDSIASCSSSAGTCEAPTFSPLHSVDDILQLVTLASRPNRPRSVSTGRKRSCHTTVPKVIVTRHTKDDNYFVERPMFPKFKKGLDKNWSCPVRKSLSDLLQSTIMNKIWGVY